MKQKSNPSNKIYIYISLSLLVIAASFIAGKNLVGTDLKLSSDPNLEIAGSEGEVQTIPPKCFGINNCGWARPITGIEGSWKSLDEAKEKALENCNKAVEERKEETINCVLNALTLCPSSDCTFNPHFVDDSGPCSLSDGEIIEPIIPYANNPATGPYCYIARCKEIGKPLEWCIQVYDRDGKTNEKCVDYPSVICEKKDLDHVSFNCMAQDKWVYANPTCLDN